MVTTMTTDHLNDTNELPLFPTEPPAVFADPAATAAFFETVLGGLADVVDVDGGQLDEPTPCAGFTVSQLRDHVLGWLGFFAAALTDPAADNGRPDPETWELGDRRASDIVQTAAEAIGAAISNDVHGQVVVMSQARMAGDGVLAMALGEYLIHGWDLAVSTGRRWLPGGPGTGTRPEEPAADGSIGDVVDRAAEAALAFLQSTVAPEHRGPDSGFFDAEVSAPADAGVVERLLCFAGRDADWRP